jgi:tetratricopeptide (TPR) repeat protein
MTGNNTKAMIVLLIISWLTAGLFGFLYATGKAQNSRLDSSLFASRQNIDLLRKDMKDYARLKQEKSGWDKSALEFIQWKFVLKQEILLSGIKISNEISKLKDKGKEKDLAALLYNNLGLAYTMSMDFDPAIGAFQQAVSLKSNEPNSYYCLGLLYSVYRGDRSMAIKNYTKFLELAPKSPQAPQVRDRIKALENR